MKTQEIIEDLAYISEVAEFNKCYAVIELVKQLTKKLESVRDNEKETGKNERNAGRKPDPNSKRQRVLRGEITKYEAYYSKTHTESNNPEEGNNG